MEFCFSSDKVSWSTYINSVGHNISIMLCTVLHLVQDSKHLFFVTDGSDIMQFSPLNCGYNLFR